METGSQISPPSQEAIKSAEKLYDAIQMAFPEAVSDFESKWTAEDAVCHSQTTSARYGYVVLLQSVRYLSSLSSLNTYGQTDEFEALKKLGPKIIPFVVFKLARDTDQNSYGVFLCNPSLSPLCTMHLIPPDNALEKDPNYCGTLDEAAVSKEGLWRCSSEIVELNCQRNKIVEEHVRSWKDYCEMNQTSSDSAVYTGCEPYWDLLEMGPSIIAHLMVEYYHSGGFWFQLLHEIIHGRKMGAYMYQMYALFEAWCQWFNKGEHDQAPLYIPTPMDRYILHGEVRDYVPTFLR
ncbi:hypothetical protein DV736_g751, partial [Chaetothyriales sp. CBS 134916]